MKLKCLLFVTVITALSTTLWARPEYALKQKMECNLCHTTPWGGGPRTVFGKIYGSRNQGMAFTSKSDLYYGDLRALYFLPTKSPSNSANGLILMQASASANVPIIKKNEQNKWGVRGLFTQDFGTLSPGPREMVAIFETPSTGGLWPTHLTFGRFYAPFGLLTDEHRTYTRMQTLTTLRDFEIGATVSGNPTSSIHYDLSLTNGFQSGGAFTVNDLTYATIANLRWNPTSLPFFLGSSFSYHATNKNGANPYAVSGYSGLNFYQLTDNLIKASLLGEVVLARHWNQTSLNHWVNSFFVPPSQPGYAAAVADSPSLGVYSEFKYDLFENFTLSYKFDSLAFNTDFLSDSFLKHSYGVRYQPLSNVILLARHEIGVPLRPGFEAESSSRASQNIVWMMLRLWL